MRALVTGGHGFIGSHLVDALLGKGLEVRAMASPWGKVDNLALAQKHADFELVRADIREPESLRPALEDVEIVFHCAARVADWGKWEQFEQTNIVGTKHVLEEAHTAGCRRFV